MAGFYLAAKEFGVNKSSENQSSPPYARRIIVGVLLAGAALLIGMDLYIGAIVYRQWETLGWPSSQGLIESVEIIRVREQRDDLTRPRFRMEVKYRYEVDGQAYTGERWRYGGGVMLRDPAMFPNYDPGDMVQVYYDPADPSRAVLTTGLTDLDRALLLFISQLNLPIVLVLVFVAISRMRPSTGVPVRHIGSRVQVRVSSFTPLAAILPGVVVGAVGAILLGWLVLGTDPQTTIYLLLVAPTLALVFAAITYFAQRAGAGCVVHDTTTDALSFATQVGTAQERVTVRRDRLDGIGVVEEVSPINTSTWCLVIRARGENEDLQREMRVGRWARADDAAAVADWLARHLKVPRQGATE